MSDIKGPVIIIDDNNEAAKKLMVALQSIGWDSLCAEKIQAVQDLCEDPLSQPVILCSKYIEANIFVQTDVLKKIHFDRAGFGSMLTTYRDAQKEDKSITMNDVKDFFEEFVDQKKQQRGFNSFIAPHHKYEYQADLFFLSMIFRIKISRLECWSLICSQNI